MTRCTEDLLVIWTGLLFVAALLLLDHWWHNPSPPEITTETVWEPIMGPALHEQANP
jgi:hypothetical protein